MALVHWARSSTEYQTTALALSEWDAANTPPNLTGQTVLIKPNTVCTNPSPYATHAEVVHAVIHWCLSHGATAGNITVADRSDPGWDTDAAFAAAGLDDVITDNGCNYLNFADGTYTVTTPENAGHWTNGLQVADAVLNADYLINVPVAKHHLFHNHYSFAIKNGMGILSDSGSTGRIFAHGADPTNGSDIDHRLPQIWLARIPNLIVGDCTHVCLTNGPFGIGDESDPMIVLVTTDAVAADASAMAILKHRLVVEDVSQPAFAGDLWSQGVIANAAGVLGITGSQEYTYDSTGIDEIADYLALLGVTENPTALELNWNAVGVTVGGTFYGLRRYNLG